MRYFPPNGLQTTDTSIPKDIKHRIFANQRFQHQNIRMKSNCLEKVLNSLRSLSATLELIKSWIITR